MIFVVYMGGTAGDLVASMIDWQDSRLEMLQDRMELPLHRQQLKKPHTFASDEEKDQYVREMSQRYRSLPSHDLDYHLKRQHRVIGIAVETPEMAQKAALRFKRSHRARVWESVCQGFGIETTRQYADLVLNYSSVIKEKVNVVITMEDIINGNLLRDLSSNFGIGFSQKDIHRYNTWMNLINGRTVY